MLISLQIRILLTFEPPNTFKKLEYKYICSKLIRSVNLEIIGLQLQLFIKVLADVDISPNPNPFDFLTAKYI